MSKPFTTTIQTFKVDEPTMAAIDTLVRAAGPGVARIRSTVIRRAILEAAERVKARARK